MQAIWDLYGPDRTRKAADAPIVQWKRIKGTITKRERLYEQFMKQFSGDKDRFFAFFTINKDESSRKRKRKGDLEDGGQLRAMRKVVEAIPRCIADVAYEKGLPKYLDETGDFSEVLWEETWAGKNNWEIWRAVGKERY